MLDNFVQMQYEIVAKQLTTMRDEVGQGQRVVFLELPTSIAAENWRRWPIDGGKDRLAQLWWPFRIYLGYDRENSSCWVDGEDVYDELQTQLGLRQGHDVDLVPKRLKTFPAPKTIEPGAPLASKEPAGERVAVDAFSPHRVPPNGRHKRIRLYRWKARFWTN